MRTAPDVRGGALVVGSTGLIGRALMRTLPSGFEPVWGTVRGAPGKKRLQLDLAQPVPAEPAARQAFTAVARRMRCAFLCSAISRFEDCAVDPERSFLVNVTHTLALADFLLEQGVALVYLSSNAVFDGSRAGCDERSPPSPATEYGRQKVATEAGLQKRMMRHNNTAGPNVKIIRLTKVVSTELPLISNWINSLGAGQRISAFNDLIFAPVSLRHAIAAIVGIGAAGRPGIYHVSGSKDISYYDFACALARCLGADPGLVSAGRAADRPGVAAVPCHSALDMAVTTRDTGVATQHLDDLIEDLVEENRT